MREDIMKSAIVTAFLLTAMSVSSPPAFAQEPEAPPEPAARRAVPRVQQAENPNPPEARPAREPAPIVSSRPDQASSSPAPAEASIRAAAANAEQQGGVRRPRGSSGGGRSGGDGGASGGAARRGRSGSSDDGRGQSDSPVRGRAVSRAEAPRSSRPVYVYRPSPWYYDPWGYGYGYGAYGYGHGGFGIGYSYYSPWAWRAAGPGSWGPGYGPGYGPGWYGARGYDTGRVRLRVSPRDAEVFVDGYYAGIVDDFDGTFQGLRLDPGGYRIEVRKPGFEPLTFDVRVQFDRTITFRGELKTQP